MSETLDERPRELLLRNAYRLVRRQRRYGKLPIWSFVSEVTGHGSTLSMKICRELGWDPWLPVGRDLPPMRNV